MALNYYEGWTEAELLKLRKEVQQSLATGRTTEIRLAGESTRTDDRNAAPLEVTLERIAYALYRLYATGETNNVYSNPFAEAGVTRQQFS